MTVQELERGSPADGLYDLRDQLKRHVYGRSEQAFAAGDAARDAIRTPLQLAQRQQAIRRFFSRCLGGLPPRDTPLNARIVGVVQGDGFTIEKVIFESRPHHFVTANLYLPGTVAKRTGAVLFLCGHHEQAKHVPEYQSVCQTLVQAGLVVLAQDPIGQGERLSYYEPRLGRTTVAWGHVQEHDYAGCQCLPLGDAIARYFLHDAMRGIDYLCSRPEVDARKIGVTGNSGGGTQSSLLMLADPRLAAAAPGTFIMNRETYMWCGGAQDAEQIWPGFTAAGFDHEDILLAMAPKPVRVLAVTSDFFPIEGTRRTVERARRIWRLCGRASHFDLVEDQCTHQFTPKLARAAAEFFALHLLGVDLGAKPLPVSVFEPSRLWCTRSGQVRGEMAGACSVHAANCERLVDIESQRGRRPLRKRQSEALAWLRKRVFCHRKPVPLNPRFMFKEIVDGLWAESAMWWSQEGILNHGTLFRAHERDGKKLAVVLAVWDGGTTALQGHWNWIRSQCRHGRAVLVMNVTGAGSIAPHPLFTRTVQEHYGILHKLADDLIWLDDDLAALRTFDVIRTLDLIEECPGLLATGLHVYAHGKHGIYGQLAAALDRRIRKIEVHDGIGSFAKIVRARHYDFFDIKSVIVRDVVNHFDLDDLRKWRNA